MPEQKIFTPPIIDGDIIFPDPITSNAILWLQQKQPDFTQALSGFGKKIGLGFECVRKPFLGQFTGAGLCNLAVAIQEEALIRKYGDSLYTLPYFLCAERRDLDTYNFPIEKTVDHWILLFRGGFATRIWYFSDPTHRQFLITTDPDKMIVGAPAASIEAVYGSKESTTVLRGVLLNLNLEAIKKGEIGGVTESDYLELLEAFI